MVTHQAEKGIEFSLFYKEKGAGVIGSKTLEDNDTYLQTFPFIYIDRSKHSY